MTELDLLDELATKMYEPPLSEMRESGAIGDKDNPITTLMLVIDFETEVMMNGVDNFLGNSSGRFAMETVRALERIGCSGQAASLLRMIEIAAAAGMTHEAIQLDRAGMASPSVSNWSEVHGAKWDAAYEAICSIDDAIDYEEMMTKARAFAVRHDVALKRALGLEG
jgi:hypothetical protein